MLIYISSTVLNIKIFKVSQVNKVIDSSVETMSTTPAQHHCGLTQFNIQTQDQQQQRVTTELSQELI